MEAFAGASNMTSITIPASVTSIGQSAFFYASSLTAVHFLGNAPSIGFYAFTNTGASAKAVIQFGATGFAEVGELWNGLTIEFAPCFTVTYDFLGGGGSCGGEVVIPDGVTVIGDEAFKSASLLTSITIPASVTVIGADAFKGASSLTSISFLGNAPTVGADAFSDIGASPKAKVKNTATGFGALGALWNGLRVELLTCFRVTDGVVSHGRSCADEVVLTEGVTSIADNAFKDATSLTSITIPASVTSIGMAAFQGATALASISFAEGSGLLDIGGYAFQFAALTSITIPASVTSLGDAPFANTSALASVSFAENSQLTSIPVAAFLLATSLTSIAIPDSVTHIGSYAFNQARALTSITIPASITSIGAGAFGDATALTSVYFVGDAPSVGADVFSNIGTSPKAYVLASATGFGAGGDTWNGLTVDTGLYVASYNSKGGSEVGDDIFLEGGSVDEPSEPSRTGYTFAGWSATDGGVAVSFPYSPGATSNITLYARWTPNTYTVTFNSKGGSAVNGGTFVTGGSIAAPTAPTFSGYTFAGWSATDGGVAVSFPYSPGVTSNITLYARWTLNAVRAVAVVKPTVTGTARVGQTLTANKGTWTGTPTPTFTYQWYSCTRAVASPTQAVPGVCKTISGATRATFKLVAAQKGKWVTVLVSGTSAGTTRTSWLAKSTGKVG